MNDLISKQAAIDALQEVSEHYTEKGREWHPHVNFMIDAIKELPSVNPQPKAGRWILTQRDKYVEVSCSECNNVRFKDYTCGRVIDELDLLAKMHLNFCECCGTKMQEVEE